MFNKSIQALRNDPVPSADQAYDLVPIFADFTLTAALAAGDIIEMLPIPAGYVPVDFILDSSDLDTGGTPAITLDVGLLSKDYNFNDSTSTMGAEFIAGSTVAQNGGIARMSVAGATKIAPTTNDRAVGIKCAVAPATGATTGTIRLTAMVRPQINGL